MYVASSSQCHNLFRRGATTSRVLTFELSQLGIDQFLFLKEFGEAVRSAPYDQYDPAIAAEDIVSKQEPGVYEKHEEEWIRCWESLHCFHGLGYENRKGPDFWLRRITNPSTAEELKNTLPFRQRCCRRYISTSTSDQSRWKILDVGTPAFTQKVSDQRARVRKFPPLSNQLINNSRLLGFIANISEIVSHSRPLGPRSFQITLHLMLTHAGVRGRMPAPEGMHQDGANYIVSAVVLERQNVTGGASVIVTGHAGGPHAVDSITLAEGQGILQADLDSDLWHGVTPIRPVDLSKPSFRSILGLDVSIL